MSDAEREQIFRLALGRIFRLGSRPEQPGDIAEYENARRAIYAAYDAAPFAVGPDRGPNWALQRRGGAAGQ